MEFILQAREGVKHQAIKFPHHTENRYEIGGRGCKEGGGGAEEGGKRNTQKLQCKCRPCSTLHLEVETLGKGVVKNPIYWAEGPLPCFPPRPQTQRPTP